MNPGEINCKQLVELATSYLEQALAPQERVLFEEHLVGCAGCRAYMDQMQHTIRLLGTLGEEAVAAEAKQNMLDVFRAWRGRQGR